MDEIRHCLSGKSPPAIIAFTETWLNDTIVNGDIAVQGYSVYRKDRNRHGGGIAVYVADRLKVTRRSDLEMDDIELIWLELRERATRRALFGAAYRPPNSDGSFMENFSDILFRVRVEDKEITILGDLNCDFLKSASHTTLLLDILAENNLQQLINKPSRITSGGESLIDVMITSCEARHWETGCEDCCLSDHQMIYGIKTEVTK